LDLERRAVDLELERQGTFSKIGLRGLRFVSCPESALAIATVAIAARINSRIIQASLDEFRQRGPVELRAR
jgi:hypothetical protein